MHHRSGRAVHRRVGVVLKPGDEAPGLTDLKRPRGRDRTIAALTEGEVARDVLPAAVTAGEQQRRVMQLKRPRETPDARVVSTDCASGDLLQRLTKRASQRAHILSRRWLGRVVRLRVNEPQRDMRR